MQMCKALQFLRVKKYAKAIEALKAFEKKDPALPTLPPRTLPHPGDGGGSGNAMPHTEGGGGGLATTPRTFPESTLGACLASFLFCAPSLKLAGT